MHLRPIHIACTAALALPGAHAQTKGPGDYPTKPIRLVVPFVPGGPTDIQGRMLGEKLGQRLGQQVIVDNRGGAGGNIGMEITARAPADGYTLVIATVGTWAVNPHLYKLPFDVVKDFSPITQVSTSPGVLVVHPTRAREEREGADRAREGETRRAQLRLVGRRRLRSRLGRALPPDDRRRR